MKKKGIALLLSACIIVMLFGGYSVIAAGTSSSETTLLGQVTAISGSSVTLALGTENRPDNAGSPPSDTPTGAPTGAPPSGSSGTSDTTPGTGGGSGTTGKSSPPAAPTSGNGGQMPGGLTLTGETTTITVSGSTSIKIEKTGQTASGTLADITVGSVLKVTLSGSTVTAVVIMQSGGQQSITAIPGTSKVTVNGSAVTFEAYNINGSNYIKLRDLAAALEGTAKQFEITYNSSGNAINMISGRSYTAVGGELKASGKTASVTATLSTATVTLDDQKISLTAYIIGGYNYFKLRDVASALDFGVTYDSTTGTINIDTTTGYTADVSQTDNGGGSGMPPGGTATVSTGTGATVLADGETLNGGTYASSTADENAVRAEGAITASLNGVTVTKSGDASSSDASSFYGLNAAILALDKAVLDITGGTVTASGEGANGVFAYNGATVNITGTVISVTGGNAGGIEVAGGGILNATDLTVNAAVKAAIRSDRGGGTLTVNGGTYTTSGSSGAPAIYSTADITATGAVLTANDSEAVVVEGFNSVTLKNCAVTGNMSGTYGSTGDNIHNVMLYQSMSGDAQTGTSSFTMTGGSLVSKNGDMFYVTNTSSVISLSGVKLTLADGTNLLTVAGNNSARGWGTAGNNGGICAFNLSGQTLSGNVTVDSISKLNMNISDSSSFTGAVNADGTAAASLSVSLDATSTWTLTADSYITSFTGSLSQVTTNGHTLYVNGTAMK